MIVPWKAFHYIFHFELMSPQSFFTFSGSSKLKNLGQRPNAPFPTNPVLGCIKKNVGKVQEDCEENPFGLRVEY